MKTTDKLHLFPPPIRWTTVLVMYLKLMIVGFAWWRVRGKFLLLYYLLRFYIMFFCDQFNFPDYLWIRSDVSVILE